MNKFNPIYDDGYFKALLDLKEFLSGAGVRSFRGVRLQRSYINSFIDLLLKDRDAREYFRFNQNIGQKVDKSGKIIKWSRL